MNDVEVPVGEKMETRKRKPLVPKREEDHSNDEKVVTAVLDLFEEASRARLDREPTWMTCLAYEAGDQTREWSSSERRWMNNDSKLAPWRSRHVQNEIKPAVDQLVAILTAESPALVVSPASSDFEDTSIAEVGTAILEKLRQSMRWRNFDILLKKHKAITGTAALEVWWDPEQPPYNPRMVPGEALDEDPESPTFGTMKPTGEMVPALDDDGEVIMDPVGGFRMDFRSTLETYLDPCSPFEDQWRYLIIATLEDTKELERQYHVKLKTEDNDGYGSQRSSGLDANSGPGRTAMLLREAASFFGSVYGSYFGSMRDRVGTVAIRCYLAPSPECPSGRLVIIAEDKIIYDDVSPGRGVFRWPVFVFRHYHGGMNPYGDGVVNSLVPPQKELNKTIRQAIECREYGLRPKWVVDRACNISQNAITTEPGEVVFFDGTQPDGQPVAAPPSQINPAPIPDSLWTLKQSIIESIERISGIFEAQRGQNPDAMRSAKGLQVLQGQSTLRLSRIQRLDYEVWAEIGRYLLWLCSQYWDDGKIVRYTGRDYQPAVAAFRRANFLEPVDVIVENDDALPQDPAQRGAVLAGLFQTGGIMSSPDVNLRMKYLRYAKLNDLARLQQEANADVLNTRRKYQLCMQGVPQVADLWEHHETCRRELAELRKQKDYYDLAAMDPRFAQLVDALDRSHADFLGGTAPAGGGTMPGMGPTPTPRAMQVEAETPNQQPKASPPAMKIPSA